MSYSAQVVKIYSHDFNGGEPELIIHWRFTSGHSGWGGGVAEESGIVEVIDTENSSYLLSLDHYVRLETWTNQYLKLDSNSLTKDGGQHIYTTTDTYCEEYQIKIRDQYIDIIPIDNQNCKGIHPEEEFQTWSLKWQEKAFYKKD